MPTRATLEGYFSTRSQGTQKEVEVPKVKWEELEMKGWKGTILLRAKVPGGWLMGIVGGGMTFVPDPDHKWDGNSLP